MEQSTQSNQQSSNKESAKNDNTTNGRDSGLDRDPKREKLPVNDELEILKSQKGKKVDGDPYDDEKDRPAE